MKIVSGIIQADYNFRKDNFQYYTPTDDKSFWQAFTHAVENSGSSISVVLSMISPEMYGYYNKGGNTFKAKAKSIIKDIHGKVKD